MSRERLVRDSPRAVVSLPHDWVKTDGSDAALLPLHSAIAGMGRGRITHGVLLAVCGKKRRIEWQLKIRTTAVAVPLFTKSSKINCANIPVSYRDFGCVS